MVSQQKTIIEELKKTFNDFNSFIQISIPTSPCKSDLVDYSTFLKGKNNDFQNCISDFSPDNATRLYYLLGGLSRYFHEFNWINDMELYKSARVFLEKMNSQAQILLDMTSAS